MEETVHGSGTVQPGSLIVPWVNALKSCQKDDDPVAQPLPDAQHHQNGQGHVGVCQPCDFLHAEDLQNGVHKAKVLVQHPCPDDGHRHHGGDEGQKIDALEHLAAADVGIQQHRKEKGNGNGQGCCHQCQTHGVFDGKGEIGIAHQVAEIVKAPGVHLVLEVVEVGVEAHEEGFADGIDLKNRNHQQCRQQIQPCLVAQRKPHGGAVCQSVCAHLTDLPLRGTGSTCAASASGYRRCCSRDPS